MDKTGDEYRAEAEEHERRKQESWDRSDTDGFLSQWASDLGAQEARMNAQIADRGGVWDFPILQDSDGNKVAAKLIRGRYGMCWALMDDMHNFTGVFISDKIRSIEKHGYTRSTEEAPARARIGGTGHGLSGTCWVEVVREDE